jgi:hypothetical protein
MPRQWHEGVATSMCPVARQSHLMNRPPPVCRFILLLPLFVHLPPIQVISLVHRSSSHSFITARLVLPLPIVLFVYRHSFRVSLLHHPLFHCSTAPRFMFPSSAARHPVLLPPTIPATCLSDQVNITLHYRSFSPLVPFFCRSPSHSSTPAITVTHLDHFNKNPSLSLQYFHFLPFFRSFYQFATRNSPIKSRFNPFLMLVFFLLQITP